MCVALSFEARQYKMNSRSLLVAFSLLDCRGRVGGRRGCTTHAAVSSYPKVKERSKNGETEREIKPPVLNGCVHPDVAKHACLLS